MSEHARRTGRHRAGRPIGRRTHWGRGATVTAAGALGAAVAMPAMAGAASVEPGSPSGTSTAAREARAEPLVAGTPCSTSARACVDLETDRAWLIDDGEVVRGPMRVSTGSRGYETPVGHSFRVYRHDADHVSAESTHNGRPSPMPYSTFFADGGVAFHGGDPSRASAGCVHLSKADAEAVYDFLQDGDKVQVVKGSQERAARRDLA